MKNNFHTMFYICNKCLKMRLYPNVEGGNTFSKSMLLIIYCHSWAIGSLGFCLFEEKSQNNLTVTEAADANHHSGFTQSFCSKSLWPWSTLCFLGKKSIFVWNDQKGSKWSQNGPKWSKTCYIDHLGSFWALLDRFGTSASLPCSAIFGPKRAILDPSAHMIEGWQWPKLLQTNLVYV